MKSLFASAFLLAALPLCAQTAGTAPAPSNGAPATPSGAPAAPAIPARFLNSPLFSTLTPADKTEFANDYTQAMIQNPELLAEEVGLRDKGRALHGTNPSPADRQAFRDLMKVHFDKVRAAIIAVDPRVEPILMRIDTQMAKMKADFEASHPGTTL